MTEKKKAGPQAGNQEVPSSELIVMVKPEEVANVGSLVDMLASEGATLTPVFDTTKEPTKSNAASLAAQTDLDLSVFYQVTASAERFDELAESLRVHPIVDAAYVTPPAGLSLGPMVAPVGAPLPDVTPDFTPQQGYLESAADGGIDARFAWRRPGGEGIGVNIIDLEFAWRFTHEDLVGNAGVVLDGTQSILLKDRNHGTAVVGIMRGDKNDFGITGICPRAHVDAIAINSSIAGPVTKAAESLNPGDIILIVLHYAGPRFGFELQDDGRGVIPTEWWPQVYAAIRYATSLGIIVVEAAGNGEENLDDNIYQTGRKSFPIKWQNPFRRTPFIDSGAILVGAGAPPIGDHGPDRSRIEGSNYGSIVDAQGWGFEVTTLGYGDLQGDGINEDRFYTATFAGTSAAAPMVAGALACVQGVLRNRGLDPLTPAEARRLLHNTGRPQQDAPDRPATQRIGNRADLREFIPAALALRGA